MTDKWDRKTNFCCGTCAYYVPKQGDSDIGRCRRNAPTMAGYPVVFEYVDWCGEHKLGSNPSKFCSQAKKEAKEAIERALDKQPI